MTHAADSRHQAGGHPDRQCWAITKTLARCKRKGPWRLLCAEHGSRVYLLGVSFVVVTFVGSIASVVSFYPYARRWTSAPPVTEYYIAVHTVDERGSFVDGQLETSVNSIITGSGHSWMVDIPASNRPANGRVGIDAVNAIDFLRGHVEITLLNHSHSSVTITMKRDRSAHAVGQVITYDGSSVPGAIIYPVGHEEATVTTGEKGQFDIAANAAPGEYIRLHVEKTGYDPEDQVVIAGSEPAVIVLSRRTQ